MAVDIPYQNPFQPPEADVLESTWDPGEARPVPWEDPEAFPTFWKRLGGMFSLLFSRPMELLDRIPVTEGVGAAWRFSVLMAVPYLAFMLLVFAFVGSVTMFTPPDPHMPKGLMAGIFGGEFAIIVLMLMAGMFVAGAVLHALLWMWGGTRNGQGLGQTIRLCGYAWGFVHLGMVVPCVNFFAGLAGLAYVAMGLARIHRTDTWRAVCAVLTPVLLCCLGYGLIFAIGFGMGAFNH